MVERANSTSLHRLPKGMRDWLPPHAATKRALASHLVRQLELWGYALVEPAAFELADVVELGLGTLSPDDLIRFVEPDTGRIAALRPDMTPQLARVVATRMADRARPLRLCYTGSVVRRPTSRGRRHRQIPQAGVELIGKAGISGDIEVLSVLRASLSSAELPELVIELGHAGATRSLLAELPASTARAVSTCLARKDGAALSDVLSTTSLDVEVRRAIEALPRLHGTFTNQLADEATAALGATKAVEAVEHLVTVGRSLAAELDSDGWSVRLDFGEVRGFDYYTGLLVHAFAPGPGEPVAAGGRYDELLGRFGLDLPAVGFAINLDALAWARRDAGRVHSEVGPILVFGGRAEDVARRLRAAERAAVVVASAAEADSYAQSWPSGERLDTDSADLDERLNQLISEGGDS